MKYQEQAELVASLRELADFYERPKSVTLPCPDIFIHEYPAVYGMIDVVQEDGEKKREYGVKVAESLTAIKGIAKVLGSCEKDYDDSSFKLRKKFGSKVTLIFSVTREAVCRKVPTGEMRTIEAMPARPARQEPVYEYICEDVSLLAS